MKKKAKPRTIPPREELLSLDKLTGDWKKTAPEKEKKEKPPKNYEMKKATKEDHIKIYLERLEKQKAQQREKRKKPVTHWENDPYFETGYEEPTPEERDEWYNRDRF